MANGTRERITNLFQQHVANPSMPGASDYHYGPNQLDTPRGAVGICTAWPHRHGFSL
jgi:hypothetical protein